MNSIHHIRIVQVSFTHFWLHQKLMRYGVFLALISVGLLYSVDSWAQNTDIDICGRTSWIRIEIFKYIPDDVRCHSVPTEYLTRVIEIDVKGYSIRTLGPDDFQGLSGLEKLDLSHNNIKTLPDGLFDGLTSLKELYLDHNDLSSVSVGLFSELSSIERLSLGENTNLVTLPEDLFQGLTTLLMLDLQETGLKSLPEDLFDGLSNLHVLYLGKNALTSLPSEIFDGLSELETLDLNSNPLASLQVELFDGLGGLLILDLVKIDLASVHEDLFDEHPRLEYLYLQHNRLTSVPAGLFEDLSDLKELNISHNSLTSVPDGLFDGLYNLKELYFNHNGLTSTQEGLFDDLTSLNKLILNDNALTELPAGLFDFKDSNPSMLLNLHKNQIQCLPKVILENPYLRIIPRFIPCGLTISLNPSRISEDKGVSTVTATRFPAPDIKTTLRISVAPVSPATEDDYTMSNFTTLTIDVGQTNSTSLVAITAVDNDVFGPPEKQFIVSGSVEGNTESNPEDVTLTIYDDEVPIQINLSLSDNPIGENGGTTTVSITLGTASKEDMKVTISATPVSPASEGDYELSDNPTLTIAEGETRSQGVVTITAVDNDVYGPPQKMITVSGSSSVSTAVINSATLTIEDDETQPSVTLALSPDRISENEESSTVIATLNRSSTEATTVTISAVPISPASGEDYTLSTNTILTIPARQLSSTGEVTITARDNDVVGPSEKKITLSGRTSSLNADDPSDVELTIVDDDVPQSTRLSLNLSENPIDEKGGISKVSAVLDQPSSEVTTVTITTSPSGQALESDYTVSPNKIITINANETSSPDSVTITAVDNDDYEGDKFIRILGTSSNPSHEQQRFVLIIEEDESPPRSTLTLTLSTPRISENDGTTTVTASLSEVSAEETTVTISADPVSPASINDFTLSSNTILTIPAGQTESSGVVTIMAVDNQTFGPPEKRITVSGTSSDHADGPADITLIIEDDDSPPRITLNLSPNRISENQGLTTVTATLSRVSSEQRTLTISATPVSPASGGDFLLSSNKTLTIPAGQTKSTGSVTIRALNNQIVGPQSKEITVSGTSPADTQGPDDIILIIEDDDEQPTVSLELSDYRISENNETITITATLNQASSEVTTVAISADPVSPASASDYHLSINTTLTIPAGQTNSTGLVTITTIDDDDDGPETKEITVSGTTTSSNADDPDDLTLIIEDDDGPPSVTIELSANPISENNETTTITAALDKESSEETTVTISADPISPARASDYTLSINTTLTIPAGQINSTGEVTITSIDDDTSGPPKKEVIVSGISSSNAEDPDNVTLIIEDDDGSPLVSLELSKNPISENQETITITAALDKESSEETTVTISANPISPARASDYTLSINTTLTIPAGQTSSTGLVTITTIDNDTDGPERKEITVSAISSSNAEGPDNVTLIIEDDDEEPTVTLELSAYRISEDDESTTVTASLNQSSTEVTEITITADPVSPATANDFTLSSNVTLTIPVGQTSSTGLVTITAIDNDTDGPERKEITVSGISSSNAEGPDNVTLIIEDDDEEPVPLMLSIERVGTAYEGVSTGQLRVELNRPADRVVTVQYATRDSSATAPSDFVASQGLVIFDPNATRGVVQVMIVDDEITENAENLIVEISNPIGAIVKDGEGVGILTIEDNDTASAVVRIEDEVGLESDGMIRFRVHMSVPSSEPVSVSYHTRDGTAKAGEDYHADAGVIEFVPGVVESTIDIVLLRDSLDWADETFSVHLGKSTHGRIEKDVAVATIQKKTTAVQDILVPYVARFLRTSSMHLVMSVQDRVESESGASVCGAVNRTNLVRLWQTASDWQPSMGELLAGCHVSTAQADGRFGVWGRGAYRRFRGQESDALQLRGSVATGLLGVDYRWNGSWMAGLMLAHSRGDGSYEILQDTGELEAGLTGLYPYVSYQHRMGGVWGTGGFGRGRVEGQDASGRLTSTFGAIGGWGKLLSVYQLRLSYHGDLWVAHADVADPDLSAQVFQTRLGMQASLNLGTYIHPFMQANVRQDGGDAETGLGFELGGGVRVSVPALKLKADVRSQGLILHAADGYSEWGISGSMQVGESEGLMVRVRPSWGASQSTSLHHHQTVLDVVPQGDYRTEMEVGYGIAMGATTARTVTGATLHPNGTMLRLGGEFRPKDGMTVTMLVHAPAQRHPNIGLNLRGLLRF